MLVYIYLYLHLIIQDYLPRTDQNVCLTNLADELSELVQVAMPVRSDAQLPDPTVKLLRSLKWILQ